MHAITRHKKNRLRVIVSLLVLIGITAGVLRVFLTTPTKVLADSLLSFDEGYGTSSSVNDSQGIISPGSITNATWKTEEFCKSGKCLYFDGSGDYVNFGDPSNASLDFLATDSFTIQGWFRTPDITSGQRTIIAKHNATAGGFKIYMDSSGYITFAIDDDSTWSPDDAVSSSTTTFDDNAWHFFSAVKSGTSSISLYVDGVLYQTDSSLAATGSLSNANNFYVGIDGDGASNGFSGFLDQIVISHSAKSATRIIADFAGVNQDTLFASMSENLAGHWKLDENTGTTANDSSGNGNTGTLTNTPTWSTGKFGSSVYFDTATTNKYITAAASSSLDNLPQFTYSAWVNPGQLQNGKRIISKAGGVSVTIQNISSSNRVYFNLTCSGGDMTVQTTATDVLTVGAWNHVLVTWDGKSCTLPSSNIYINGKLAAKHASSVNASGTKSSDSYGPLTIGNQYSSYTAQIQGYMDDVRVYSRAFSAAEAAYLYTTDLTSRGSAAVFAPDQSPLSDGLVGYWKMDENTGTSVADLSGGGNTAALTNSPTWDIGRFGTGVKFSSSTTNQYINVPASTNIDGLSKFSWSVWVNPSQLQDNKVLMRKSGNIELYLETISSGLRTQVYIDCQVTGLTRLTTSADNLKLNGWNHIVFVYDGGGCALENVQLYINGAIAGQHANSDSGSGAFDNSDTGVPLTIGNSANLSAQVIGLVDEVRVYNRAISQAEARQLYSWSPGPVGWWKMDENTGQSLYDSSGNGNTGSVGSDETVSSDDPKWTSGKYGSGLNFDGINDDARFPDSDNYTFGNATSDIAFTVSEWVNVSNNISHYLVDKSNEWQLRLGSDGRIICTLQDNSTGGYIGRNSSAGISANVWHNVACTYDGSRTSAGVRIYVDGVRVDNANETSGTYVAMENQSTSVHIYDDPDFPIGKYDDLRIYRYERSPSQIVEDMNGGHPPSGSPVGSSIIHWKFDESGGVTANNSGYGGSAYNGTITGATWYTGGRFGSALAASTSTNTISAGDVAFVDGLTGITTSVWVKPVSLATNKSLISKSDFSSQNSFAIVTDATNSDEIRVHIPTSISNTGTYFRTSNLDLANDTWSLLTVVYNASESAATRVRVYKDGKEKTGSVTGTLPDAMTSGSTSSLKVGASDSGSYTALNAVFDDVKIYPYALTYDQILIDANAKSATMLGSLSTDASGVASNSAARQYCPPGNTETNCASGLHPGPMAEWHLNEPSWTVDCSTSTALDTSGNNYHLRSCPSSTGPNGGMTGKLDKSGFFDGSNDYLESTSTDFNLTGGISMSAWVRPLTTASGDVYVVNRTNNNAGYSLGWAGAMGVRIQIGNGTAYSTLTGTTAMTLGQWHHIAGTVDASGNAVVYLNGKIDNSGAINILAASSGQNFRIGSRSASNTVNGYIDAVRVYRYVRTPAQVAWDYNKGAPAYWYKFDECQGTTAYNAAPTASNVAAGSNGTITIGASGTYTSSGACGSDLSTESWYGGKTGKFGASFALDGTNDYATVSDTAALRFNSGSQDFSLFAWVKRGSVGSVQYILGKEDADNDGYRLQFNADNTVTCSVDAIDITSTNTISDTTTWHSVGCVVDRDGNGQVYIDGKPDGSAVAISSEVMATTASLYIGARSYTITSYFAGQIDDVRIYTYALTQPQILMVINEGSAVRFGP